MFRKKKNEKNNDNNNNNEEGEESALLTASDSSHPRQRSGPSFLPRLNDWFRPAVSAHYPELDKMFEKPSTTKARDIKNSDNDKGKERIEKMDTDPVKTVNFVEEDDVRFISRDEDDDNSSLESWNSNSQHRDAVNSYSSSKRMSMLTSGAPMMENGLGHNHPSTRMQQRIENEVYGGFRKRHKERLGRKISDRMMTMGFLMQNIKSDDNIDDSSNGVVNSSMYIAGSSTTSSNSVSLKNVVWLRWLRFRYQCGRFINSKKVQLIIICLIILNAILMGVNLFVDPNTTEGIVLTKIDTAFLWVYTVEIMMQILYFGPNIVRDSWLMFDIFVVVFSWIGEEVQNLQGFQTFRAFRIFRTLRTLTRIRVLRDLIAALGEVFPKLVAILCLKALLLAIFGIIFKEQCGELDMGEDELVRYPFGTFHDSLLTLLEIMTLEWNSYARVAIYQISPYAWWPFVLFIFLSGIVMTNLIIAVICDAVSLIDRVAREREAIKNGDGLEEMTTVQKLMFCKNSIVRINERIQLLQHAQRHFQDLLETVVTDIIEDFRLSGTAIEELLADFEESSAILHNLSDSLNYDEYTTKRKTTKADLSCSFNSLTSFNEENENSIQKNTTQ